MRKRALYLSQIFINIHDSITNFSINCVFTYSAKNFFSSASSCGVFFSLNLTINFIWFFIWMITTNFALFPSKFTLKDPKNDFFPLVSSKKKLKSWKKLPKSSNFIAEIGYFPINNKDLDSSFNRKSFWKEVSSKPRKKTCGKGTVISKISVFFSFSELFLSNF